MPPYKPEKRVEIAVDITGPEECRLLMEKAIKFILFSRKVIPYQYNHLYSVVKQSLTNENMTPREINFASIHKEKALTIITRVDSILKGLKKEFCTISDLQIREIAFLIGPTIYCPLEAYLFKVPNTFPNKIPMTQAKGDHMKHVVLHPDMFSFLNKSIQVTNLYVLIKKPEGDKSTWICPIPHYDIPKRIPVAIVDMHVNDDYNAQMRDLSNLDILHPYEDSNEELQKRSTEICAGNIEETVDLLQSARLCTSDQETRGCTSATQSNTENRCMVASSISESSNQFKNLRKHANIPYTLNSSLSGIEQGSKAMNVENDSSKVLSTYALEKEHACQLGVDLGSALNHNGHSVCSKCTSISDTATNCSLFTYKNQIYELKTVDAKDISNKDIYGQEIETDMSCNEIWYIASDYLPGFKQPVMKFVKRTHPTCS